MKKPKPSDDFLSFITDLQALEWRAGRLGLYVTHRAINSAVQAAGWEKAGDPVTAHRKAIDRLGPLPTIAQEGGR